MIDVVLVLAFVITLTVAGMACAVDKDIEVQGAGHMAGITMKLPVKWDFRKDPSDAGRSDRWFEKAIDESWDKIDITKAWTIQPVGKDYRGIAWYHLKFRLPADVEAGQEHFAYFHALDGFADVYYHLMFPMVYHRYDQDSQIRLYSSEDGYAWNEVPGPAVITHDGFGQPYGEFIWAFGELVPWGEDRIAVLMGGNPNPHKYPRWPIPESGMSWVWWPKGRLSAIVAD